MVPFIGPHFFPNDDPVAMNLATFTVFSIAYSLAMALFAGSSPMLAEWMLHRHGWPHGPALYMAAWVMVAMVCVFRSRETYRDPAI